VTIFSVSPTGDRVQLGVGVHDALTARLAQRSGFDVAWLGSLEVSARYGVRDANVLTMTEMAAVTAEVRAACRLPIYVDADNGYGSDATAVRAARLIEAAGADAMCLEDNVFPKRNSLLLGVDRPLLEPDDFADRLAAVCKSRSRMAVIARTEALVAGLGIDAAVQRLHRYAETGVDALFVQVNQDSKDLLQPTLEQVRGLLPVVLAPTALPEVPAAQFGRWGASTVLFANLVLRTMVAALPPAMAAVRREGVLAAAGPAAAGIDEALSLVDQGGAR
jgi:phosphoenolpyruvate phosphomutase